MTGSETERIVMLILFKQAVVFRELEPKASVMDVKCETRPGLIRKQKETQGHMLQSVCSLLVVISYLVIVYDDGRSKSKRSIDQSLQKGTDIKSIKSCR